MPERFKGQPSDSILIPHDLPPGEKIEEYVYLEDNNLGALMGFLGLSSEDLAQQASVNSDDVLFVQRSKGIYLKSDVADRIANALIWGVREEA